MALTLEQGFTYLGDEYWKWWIWLEGSEGELDAVDRVIYTLHPTFPSPVRTVCDRRTKFRLETAGWGNFTIHARIVRRDGTESYLDHKLELAHPDPIPAV